MEEIIAILMKRDKCSREDAKWAYRETKEMLYDAIQCGEFDEVDEILMDMLGLEPDYIDRFFMVNLF